MGTGFWMLWLSKSPGGFPQRLHSQATFTGRSQLQIETIRCPLWMLLISSSNGRVCGIAPHSFKISRLSINWVLLPKISCLGHAPPSFDKAHYPKQGAEENIHFELLHLGLYNDVRTIKLQSVCRPLGRHPSLSTSKSLLFDLELAITAASSKSTKNSNVLQVIPARAKAL